MSSKKSLLRGVSAVLVSTLALSCTPKVGEKAPEPKQQEFSGTACLTDATKVIGEFLVGEAKDRQIEGAWDCFASAFMAFEKYVRGNSRDSYTPAEISSFFENEFIARRADGTIHAIPPSLQHEFMKMKILLVGGSVSSITRNEIRTLIQKVDRFKQMSVRLNPYMKVLLMSWKPSLNEAAQISSPQDLAFFEAANGAVQAVAKDFGEMIEANGNAYLLDDIVTFLREASSYIGQEWTVTESVRHMLPVAKKLKKTLTGGQEDQIRPSEWRLVLVTGFRTYIQYLRYYYFVELPGNVAREQRLTAMSRIVEESFSIMEGLVREKTGREVSRAEIDELLTALTNAFPEFKSSPALVSEVMKLKKLLFGGNVDRIAASDFETARLKVSRIRDLVDLLAPHAAIYSAEWQGGKNGGTEATRKEFENGGEALERAAKEFGDLLEVSDGAPYDLKSLLVLANEWNRLYPPAPGKDGIAKTLGSYLPLLLSVKNMTYGDKDSSIRPAQWASLLSLASRGYMFGMEALYFLKGQDFDKPRTLLNLHTAADRLFGILDQMLQTNPKKAFTRGQLTTVLASANGLELLPKAFNQKLMSELLKPILNRILNPPELRLKGQRPDAFRASSLTVLRREFSIWNETALFLSNTFGGGSDATRLQAAELQNAIDRQLAKKSNSENLAIGLKELKSIFNTSQSLVLDKQKRLYISGSGRLKYNLVSVQQHNLLRAVSRLFISSYAGDLGRIRRYQGVTLSEARTAFKEFFNVGVALDLIGPSNTGFMDSRFREANLFLPRSDGNGLASFVETHELMFLIMSGLTLDEKMKKGLASCPGARGKSPRVALDCMFSVYRSEWPQQVSSMPELVAFQRSVTGEVFGEFFYNTLKGAGWVPNAQNTVTFSDASLFPHLLQYIEIVFARFDRDRNGVLSSAEAKRAFPIFQVILKELAKTELQDGTIKESELLALFTYILKYGKPPGGIWEGLTRWYPWKDNPDSWNLQANRAMLAQILGYIADAISAASAAPAPAKKASGG